MSNKTYVTGLFIHVHTVGFPKRPWNSLFKMCILFFKPNRIDLICAFTPVIEFNILLLFSSNTKTPLCQEHFLCKAFFLWELLWRVAFKTLMLLFKTKKTCINSICQKSHSKLFQLVHRRFRLLSVHVLILFFWG